MLNRACPHCEFIFLGDDLPEEGCPACGEDWTRAETASTEHIRDEKITTETPESQRFDSPAKPAPFSSAALLLMLCLGLTAAVVWLQLERSRASRMLQHALDERQQLEQRLETSQSRLSGIAEIVSESDGQLETFRAELDALQKQTDAERENWERERQAFQQLQAAFETLWKENGHSFARHWQILGPFRYRDDTPTHPFETEVFRTDAKYEGVAGELSWKPYESPEDRINLGRFFNTGDRFYCYAVCWVLSGEDREVQLSIGSDDGIVVWVNRRKVHQHLQNRPGSPGQDAVRTKLTKGWNEVRARVDNRGGSEWALYLEFRTLHDSQPLKLFSTHQPPAPRDAAAQPSE